VPAYDSASFSPPAPVARVTLRNSTTDKEVTDVPMLIDTGADVTLVPRFAIATLGITEERDTGYGLVGFGGEATTVHAVRLDLMFLRYTFRGQFLPTEETYGILGRNVLNNVRLLLNGPRLIWDETNNP
jgi:hypothetical protein